MPISAVNDVTLTGSVDENSRATLTGTITDSTPAGSYTINVSWGDGSTGVITLGASALTNVNVGGDIVTWNPTTGTYSLQHLYTDDRPTGSDAMSVTGTITDGTGVSLPLSGGALSATGGNIFMTGHDVLLHNHQNGYDAVILDYLRGAGTTSAIARADYDIGYLRDTDRGVPGGTGTGFNTSQFGTVSERTPGSFASPEAFGDWLDTVDVLYIPWILDFSNQTTISNLLASWAPQIADFINRGGDIAIESSIGNNAFYAFLPPGVAASGPSISGSTGFSATAEGAAIGLTSAMVNGNATHNRFTSFDDDFTVMEVRGTEVIAIGVRNATVGSGGISTGLSVNVVNQAPVAQSLNYAGVSEDGAPQTFALVATDAGAADTITYTVLTQPAEGVVIYNGDGTFTFAPGTAFQNLALGQTRNVSFVYRAADDDGGVSNTATVTVTVTGVNDAPLAHVDAATTGEDQSLTVDVLANDTDVDNGAVLSLASVTALKGSASIVDGKVVFNPGAAFNHLAAGASETVTLSYEMTDEHGATSTSTVNITVTGANDVPVATADTGAAGETGSATFDVLANDTDADSGAVLTLASVSASKGSATVVDGKVVFDAGNEFNHLGAGVTEEVTLTYVVQDETGAATTSELLVSVTGANDGPVAAADTASTNENELLTVDVLGNDTDLDDGAVLSLVSVSTPKGSASVVDGKVAFDPGAAFDHLAAGATETVTLSYEMTDEHGATSSSTLTVTVTGTNDAPVATADVATTGENQSVTVDVLANDADADDGAVLTLMSVSTPKGAAEVVDGKVVFDPGTAFNHLGQGATEAVTLSYLVRDNLGAETTANLVLTVTGTNDAPVATADAASVSEDASVVINVRGNDTDVDAGDTLTITQVGSTALGGSVTVQDGKLVYVADGDAFDLLTTGQAVVDTFSYTVTDSAGESSTSTVSVTVGGVANGADLVGGNKTQVLNGTALDERIFGGNADDTLYGNDGADQLYGNNGKDLLFGGQGRDRLFGENGADRLDGGLGNDTLTGGEGPDTFVFGSGFGQDVVTDFAGEDTLMFAVGVFASASQAFAAATQDGDDVLILAGQNSVRLVGVSLSSLNQGDFIVG